MIEPLTIGMVAGEPSGDTLGLHLILALRRHLPGARFTGIGGPRMIGAGFESIFPMEKLAVMGIAEVLRHFPELAGIRREASRGGEFWLQEILPQLHNTLVVLSGRARTLYGPNVKLYGSIEESMRAERIELGGVSYEAARALAQRIKQLLTAETQPESIRENAMAVVTDTSTAAATSRP